ncbi:hypothetical protein EYF80_011848 [Liparis tanakae]|uniref:Uncharacterized protein n=1 Tax=Liparis tanakae TaxID=230148 RepID=A0A4Z2IJF6_9TELE|nr:hypothetical protein EYF80_011848 [Liparis tanakae]
MTDHGDIGRQLPPHLPPKPNINPGRGKSYANPAYVTPLPSLLLANVRMQENEAAEMRLSGATSLQFHHNQHAVALDCTLNASGDVRGGGLRVYIKDVWCLDIVPHILDAY